MNKNTGYVRTRTDPLHPKNEANITVLVCHPYTSTRLDRKFLLNCRNYHLRVADLELRQSHIVFRKEHNFHITAISSRPMHTSVLLFPTRQRILRVKEGK